MTNKIGWCDMTLNPVIGCKNSCEYCYAQEINNRFKFIKNWNIPEWREKSFNKKLPKKPQRIFVGSMSEIYYWDSEWMSKVIYKILGYPQHTFIFLTKYPEIYSNWNFPKNCLLGVTVTDNKRLKPLWQHKGMVRFLSIEPLLKEIDIGTIDNFEPNWIIVGAETGNREEKAIPKKEWLNVIIDFCNRTGVPLYLKDSLKNIYPVEIKEFPEVR